MSVFHCVSFVPSGGDGTLHPHQQSRSHSARWACPPQSWSHSQKKPCPWQSPPRPWPARLALSCRSSCWRIKKLSAFLCLKINPWFPEKNLSLGPFVTGKKENWFLFHRNILKIVLTYAYNFGQWIPKTVIGGNQISLIWE